MEKIICIVGPTASGKTGRSIRLAQALGGEVLSCDSMQIYQGMDIGTAKVTPAEMQGVQHHMLDLIQPSEDYSVSRFVTEAEPILQDILRRGKYAILTGGTGLYIDSLVAGRTFAPYPATGKRQELEALAARKGIGAVIALLEQFDPDFDLLTLSEMEGDGSWTPEPDLEVADQLLRFNAADVYQDPGRGVQMWYDVSQAGYGTSGDSSMDLNYFVSDDAQAAWELLAGLVQDLQSPDGDLLSYLPDSLPFQRETVPGAEEFLVRREGENWDVVALEGDRVLALRYSGALDLTDWYGEIAAMLTPEG